MLTSEEKLQRGFRAEDDILVPLPVDSSSDEDEAAADGRHADEDLPSSASVLVEAFLEDVVQRSADACVGASASLFDLDFWQNEAAQLGLHVMRPDRGSAGALPPSAPLRRSLDRRGYLQSPTLFPGDADEATLSALRRMLARLKQLGFAPGFLYVFDEAWLVIERCMRLLGDVLVPEAGTGRGVQQLVLEPSVFAHALEKPASAEDTDEERRREAASQDASEIARHSYLGGNFGLPHRDHSSSDCFDAASGEPVLLSLWCPLTRVTADNGCMFVLPKDRDPLLHQPRHPHHLRPFDASSGTLRFGLGGAVALAPCDAGCALAWHGSLVHWGGCCSAHAEEGPRASLTAGLRLRSSRATQLQAEQSEGELTVEQLPPPLEARLRMVASSLLVYKWWFPLRGAVPARFVPAAASRLSTLEEGVLRVAVEAAHVPDPLDPRRWMLRYTEAFGSRLGLRVRWVEAPFDGSWALAGEEGAVDLVATNVAPSPQRRAEAVGAAFSDPFMYERRALRVREADAGRYATICDFGGERVGAVRGMNAEIDLRRRVQTLAPAVSVVATDTFPELYELFHRGELAAVAQAEYYAIDGSVIPSSPPGIVLVDHHDLVPGQREECAFVVRGASRGLLEAVNEFIATTAFPVAGELGKRDG